MRSDNPYHGSDGAARSITASQKISITFMKRPGEYLAFLGRICPEKRVDRAIEIAKRSGRKLKIAAKVDTADREYFSDYIKPLLNHPLIELIGENGNLPTLNFNPCSFGQTDAGNLRLAVGTAWENAHPPWFMGNWRRPERGISRKRPRAIVPHRLA
jgi:glycosyltransferase involved in cell wall biosynthesis